MIELEHVSKTFRTKTDTVHALKDITLSVSKGDIFGVIGFSGAGKSTLLRMVNGLEVPTEGRVVVKSLSVADLKGRKLRSFRKDIGMIFQHFNLLESKSVYENVALPLKLAGKTKGEIEGRVRELIHFVELDDKIRSFPRELSGGQKQRVGIARALALNPSILLCDEATSALDPRTTDSILALLKKVNRDLGVTILMITHQMNVIQQICNKVAVLENGRMIESGSVIDVFGNPKSPVTKDFIRTVINDRLPESVKVFLKNYDGFQKVLRLRFDGKNADEPIMAEAMRKTGVSISILYGIVTELEEKIVGFQTVQLRGSEEQINAAEKFFDEKNVPKFPVEL